MGGLLTNGTSYEDLTGLITIYSDSAFDGSNGTTIKLGSGLTFGNDAFISSQNSTIELGNFVASNNNTFGANSNNNTFNLKGTIGATSGDDQIFSTDLASNPNTINVKSTMMTSNGGNVEGDVAQLMAWGATVNFNL